MAIPMKSAIGNAYGREKSISYNRCLKEPMGCGGPAVKFKSEVSRKEFSISGLCQRCQDDFWGGDYEQKDAV